MKICFLGAGALGSALGGVLTEAGNEVWLSTARRRTSMRSMRAASTCARTASTGGRGPGADVARRHRARRPRRRAGEVVPHPRGDRGRAGSIVGPDTRRDVAAERPRPRGDPRRGRRPGEGACRQDLRRRRAARPRPRDRRRSAASSRASANSTAASPTAPARIADTFTRAGLATTVSDNIVGTMWDKLLVNVATGALCAITRLPYGRLYAVPEIEACAIAAVSEAMAVAAASGIRLSTDGSRGTRGRLPPRACPPSSRRRCCRAWRRARPTEVDYVNGSVVRWGERCRRRDAGEPDAGRLRQGHRSRAARGRRTRTRN